MPRARRILISILAPMTLLASVSLAAPAHAAPSPSTLYFGGPSGSVGDCSTALAIYSDAGHTTVVTAITGTGGAITLQNDCTAYAISYSFPGGMGQMSPGGSPSSTNMYTSGTLTLNRCGGAAANTCGSTSLTSTATITLTGGGGGGPAFARPAFIAPVVQQFGLPQSLTCEAAAPASLNWAGVASGGWSQSWAEWMNGGRGGAVCTRTLVYSAATAQWVVA